MHNFLFSDGTQPVSGLEEMWTNCNLLSKLKVYGTEDPGGLKVPLEKENK
jgi:hypothetical protein